MGRAAKVKQSVGLTSTRLCGLTDSTWTPGPAVEMKWVILVAKGGVGEREDEWNACAAATSASRASLKKAAVLIQAPNIETGPRRNAPALETDVWTPDGGVVWHSQQPTVLRVFFFPLTQYGQWWQKRTAARVMISLCYCAPPQQFWSSLLKKKNKKRGSLFCNQLHFLENPFLTESVCLAPCL